MWRFAAIAAVLLTLSGASGVGAAPQGSRVPWQGANWYLHGANVPWLTWACDFGCGASGGGVSAASTNALLATKFADARASGLHVVRWWVFEGDAWQIGRSAAGAPTTLNPAVYADFDAALQLADTYDLYYDFVLFSAPSAVPGSWLTDTAQRKQLADVLAPLFARYRGNPRVFSWEVFNEPELDIWSKKVAQAPVQATVSAIASSVHAHSTAYVTVGSAMLDGLGMWVGQGLDYYQAHWYDYMASGDYCARCTDYDGVRAKYNLDGPLVIGELNAAPDVDAAQRLSDFYAKGFAGAWPWSLFADHTADRIPVDLAAAAGFAGQHADLGPRIGAAATTPATSTPLATPTPVLTPTPVTAVLPDPTLEAEPPTVDLGVSMLTPSIATAGQEVELDQDLITSRDATVLVVFALYDNQGQQVWQSSGDTVRLGAGSVASVSAVYEIPQTREAGQYTFSVEVFSPDMSARYTADDAFATLNVR